MDFITTPTDIGGPAGAATRCLLFVAGGRLFGCDLSRVREIVPIRRATRLPGAPAFVLGLINLRGMVVTVMDLVRRFGGGEADPQEGSIIIVDFGTRAVGIAVDAMKDVQGVVARAVETGNSAGPGVPANVISGVAESSEGLVTLLDVGAILQQVMSSAEGEL